MYSKRKSEMYPFLIPPVVAELVVEAASGGGPLRRHPAHPSLHEAQRLLPGAHLLQQGPNVGLKNSLGDRDVQKKVTLSQLLKGFPIGQSVMGYQGFHNQSAVVKPGSSCC